MKKHLSILLILAIAFGAIFTLTGCPSNPTLGLSEVSFEDILNADLYDSYDVKTTTKTYDAEGNKSSDNTATQENLSKLLVKASLLKDKAAVEVAKKTSSNNNSRVCANKSYSKIVTYAYTDDSNGVTRTEVITTYTKH